MAGSTRVAHASLAATLARSRTLEEVKKALVPYDVTSEVPLNHYHGDNLYVRQAVYAKGSVIIGRVHKYDHVFMLLSGKITIWTKEGKGTFAGPMIIESKAGIQRIGYAHTNVVCVNMHGILGGCSDEESEEVLTVADESAFLEFIGSHTLEMEEYGQITNNICIGSSTG